MHVLRRIVIDRPDDPHAEALRQSVRIAIRLHPTGTATSNIQVEIVGYRTQGGLVSYMVRLENPPGADAPSATRSGLSALLRRRFWAFLVAFALLASAVLFAGPFLKRHYVAAARIDRNPQALMDTAGGRPWINPEPLRASLATDMTAALARAGAAPDQMRTTVDTREQGRERITVTVTADNPDRAYVVLKTALDAHAAGVHKKLGEMASREHTELQAKLDAATRHEEKIQQQVQAFTVAHPGVLPEDPNSVVARLERTRTRLEERTQRRRIVDEQLQRLEAYAARVRSGQAAPPPGLVGTTRPAAAAAVDPEVVQLRAQLALLGEQLQEQTGTLRRTEQHPYVVDLRSRQAALQKRLDAAEARAAAGQPPPPDIRLPTETGPSLVEQTLELQLQQWRSERDTLAAEMTALKAQQDQEQRQVDGLLPLRREWSGLNDQLAQAQKEKAAVRDALARFTERFTQGNPEGDFLAMQMDPPPRLPAWPRFEWLLAGAMLAGLLGGLLAAVMAEGADGSFQSAAQAGRTLSVPVLGVIDEIVPTTRRHGARVARLFVRPIIAVALAGILLLAGVTCYQGLQRTEFRQQGLWQQRVSLP